METLKFKVGDKVRVKSLKWYNENKDVFGDIIISKKYIFLDRMAEYCGKVLEITEICDDYFRTGNDYIWQEWMMESVTEEKQEVEQLNKNSMETKEMTKEEVLVYLNNTKIICTSEEETTKVQEKLFELGVEWMLQGRIISKDKYLLFINDRQKIQHCSDIDYWIKDINRRIDPTEILAIQIKEEKPKFDPKTLQPFDRVLVRDIAGKTWLCTLFSHIENEDFICTSSVWKCCIPYNEDTKHLVGTADEAPEFYRI